MHKRFLFAVLCAAFFSFFLTTAQAATQQELNACSQATTQPAVAHAANAACTRIIENRRENAATRSYAYLVRGARQHNVFENYEAALADMNEAIKLNPKERVAYANRALAQSAISIPKYKEQIIADATVVIDGGGASAAIYGARAWAYFNRNTDADNKRGANDAGMVLKLEPEKVSTHLLAGLAYMRLDNIGMAAAHYEKAVDLEPTNLEARRRRAGVASFLGSRCEVAIEDYTVILRVEPKDVEAYVGRANCYNHIDEKKADPVNALADYNEALKLDPLHKEALSRSASLYYDKASAAAKKENYEEAVVSITEVIRRRPNGNAYFTRGMYYFRIGDFAKSVADYREAVKRKDEIELIYEVVESGYYNALRLGGHYDELFEHYNKLIEKEPANAEHYSGRAQVYLAKGDYDKALADYAEVVRLEPNAKENMKIYLAFAYLGKGDHERAFAEVNSRIEATAGEKEGQGVYLLIRAELYQKLGKKAEAEADRTKARELNPNLPSALEMKTNFRLNGLPV